MFSLSPGTLWGRIRRRGPGRGWVSALFLAFLFMGTGSDAQSPITQKTFAGRPERLDYWYSTKPDCTAVGYPEVRILAPPLHGTITVGKGEGFPHFPDGTVRKACNTQKVPATLAYYQSYPEFAGTDTVIIEILYPGGQLKPFTYNIKVSALPVKTWGSNPGYPLAARIRGLEGRVIAWVHVDSEGNVTDVVIKESPHEILSGEAIATFKKWKFQPLMEDGKPVPFVGEQEVLFKLTDHIPSTRTAKESPP